MTGKILKEIQNQIIKGRLDKALSSLIEFCKKTNSDNYEATILLSTQFHIIEQKERIGLGEFNQEINRIAQSILKIVLEEEKNNSKSSIDNNLNENVSERTQELEIKIDKLIDLLKVQLDDPLKLLESEYFWRHLEPSSKNYLYSAEKTLMVDDLLDFSTVVIQYSKTIESEFINKIFLPYNNFIKTFEEKEIKEYNSRIIDLMTKFNKRQLSFSDVINYVVWGLKEENDSIISFNRFIEKRFSIINKMELFKDIEGVKEMRNRSAHVGVITRVEADQFRNKILSILKNMLNRPFEIK